MSDISQVEQIFLNAVHINPAERAQFLDEQCGQDANLRQRVEKLLAAQPHVGKFLEPSTNEPTHEYLLPETQTVGTVIANRYSLVEVIGEGGMGTVWRAKQTEPVTRYVALKLIKPGMDSKQVLARFDAERQALAMMDHPNIARILDGGIHDNRPFFVMELVKGTPITEFCDALKLTPPQRLELFLPVCQAIQHAHQKGIIHRDIKPSNVLIALYDDKPVPKVIDFGVAKATGGALTQHTIDTGFGGVVGTPQYMSPEQATFNNLDIDTRSDVYSLGTLLYELLAGSPPFAQAELEKRGLLEILRVVREEEPLRPSIKLSTAEARASISANRGSEPAQLSSMMKGEIDWIVMKALEKDRARRYDTATALAKDVQRYLNGDAVEACPPTLGYRMRKAYTRNRMSVHVASAFALLMIAAVVTSGLLAQQARRAQAVADERRMQAEANAEEAKRNADMAEKQSKLHTAEVNRAMEAELEAKSLASGLQIDIDLAEMRSNEKVGLLRLAERTNELRHSVKREYETVGGHDMKTYLSNDNADLTTFATAAVITAGQNYAPLLPPYNASGAAFEREASADFSGTARKSAFSPGGQSMLVQDEAGVVRLWDIRRAKFVSVLMETAEQVVRFGFSPDGRTLFTQDLDSVARFWDAEGRLVAKTPIRQERYIYPSDLDQANKAYYTAYGNTVLVAKGVAVLFSKQLKFSTNPKSNLSQLTSEEIGSVHLYDISTGSLLFRIAQNQETFCGWEVSPGGLRITVRQTIQKNEKDHSVQVLVFSGEDGRNMATLTHPGATPSEDMFGVAVSPNGQKVVTYSKWDYDRNSFPKVRFWNVPSQQSLTDPCIDEAIENDSFDIQFLSDNSLKIHCLDGVDNERRFLYRFDQPESITELFDAGPDELLKYVHPLAGRKDLRPPEGKRYHPSIVKHTQDGRFCFVDQIKTVIDTSTEKSFPWPGTGHHFIKDYGSVGSNCILPAPTRLDIPPALLQLWAQVAVRGELGPDGEFVKWKEETWEQKRQELAAAKPPYEDFPFPGYVATDKLHWLRAEYEAANDDKEKLRLIDELLRRAERSGDKNEVVRWQNERAKYVREPVPTE